MSEDILSEVRRDYIYRLIKNGDRIGGRKADEYRDVSVETGIIARAEGSARVKIGNTDVLAGIKAQIGEPFPDTPDKGVIITNAELVPLASPSFETGPPNENGVELARVVDKGIRGSKAIELEKLCLDAGSKVWIIFIDIHILDHDGNLIDASALASMAALTNTTLPYIRYEVGEEDEALLIKDTPIATTCADIGGEIVFDPCLDEENASNIELTVTTNANGDISGIQKRGAGKIPFGDISQIVDSSRRLAGELRKKL